MQTQIIYKGQKPTSAEIKELTKLLPIAEIELTRFIAEDIKTVIDPIYKIEAIDWTWFRKLFTKNNDISCFCLEKTDLLGLGVKTHWGFYSLDSDRTHEFYMSNLGQKLDPRAVKNGFTSNFVWMFVHEYLHGSVWSETRDREMACNLVHQWEIDGVLKEKLAEDVVKYQQLKQELSLWQWVFELLKKKPDMIPNSLLPLVQRKADAMVAEMARLGHQVRIVEGYRSIARQNILYAQGRTKSGAIVTNAKGGESLHNYGVSIDFVFRKEGYNASSTLWQLLGKVGKLQGFEWGGDWKGGFVDKPHFELKLGHTLADFQKGRVNYSKYN